MSLPALPTDIHHRILEHDEEKKRLLSANQEMGETIEKLEHEVAWRDKALRRCLDMLDFYRARIEEQEGDDEPQA